MATQLSIPLVTFKNIVVTVTEENGQLQPYCVKTIGCSSSDTIINFQIVEPATETQDYCFDQPGISGDVNQLGPFAISRSGKMLTVCDAASTVSSVHITLKVYDRKAPHKQGSFDPEVANQPDGK
jgi:hypothetical protein